MRDLVLNKIHEVWGETSELDFNISLEEIDHLEDQDLFELFVQILTNGLTTQNERYKEELRRLYGVDRPFICGWAGPKGEDELNEYVLVSKAYGVDGFIMYKRFKELQK